MSTDHEVIMMGGDAPSEHAARAIVAANILGELREAKNEVVPRVTFTDPQAAAVGATEDRSGATVRLADVARTATYTRAYAESNGYLTLLSDGDRLTSAHASAPKPASGCSRPPGRSARASYSTSCAAPSSPSLRSQRSTSPRS